MRTCNLNLRSACHPIYGSIRYSVRNTNYTNFNGFLAPISLSVDTVIFTRYVKVGSCEGHVIVTCHPISGSNGCL